jgi:transposase
VIGAPPVALDANQRSLPMPKLDERISTLEAKLKELKTKQQRIDSRARALASRHAREQDTRRKILIGATVLARIEANQMDHTELNAWLAAYLTRDDDRALFELTPRQSSD